MPGNGQGGGGSVSALPPAGRGLSKHSAPSCYAPIYLHNTHHKQKHSSSKAPVSVGRLYVCRHVVFQLSVRVVMASPEDVIEYAPVGPETVARCHRRRVSEFSQFSELDRWVLPVLRAGQVRRSGADCRATTATPPRQLQWMLVKWVVRCVTNVDKSEYKTPSLLQKSTSTSVYRY